MTAACSSASAFVAAALDGRTRGRHPQAVMRSMGWTLAAVAALAACKKAPEPKAPAADPARFFPAVRAGRLSAVQEGLKADPELARAQDPSGQWTGLHVAGSPEVAGALLEGGANLEARGANGMTPLHAAINDNRQEIVKFLLMKKASPQARTKEPAYSALQLAIARERPELTALFLELSSPEEIAEKVGGESLLHLAVRAQDATITELLLLKGADPNARGPDGRTPLFIATSTALAELLVAKGGSLSALDSNGEPPIAALLRSTAEPVAAHLLQGDALIDARALGLSLLSAVDYRAERLVKLLLERRPEFEHKKAALFKAARLGFGDLARLIGAESTATAQDAHGRNGLHFALNKEVIFALKELGTYLDARDDRGQTPLFVAAASGKDEVAQELLAHGADAGPVSNGGDTPLHMACARDDLTLAQLLVDKGAEVNIRNKHGVTPLHYAAHAGNVELAKLLLEGGADPLAKIDRRTVFPEAKAGDLPNPFAGRDVSGKSPYDITPFAGMQSLLRKHFPRD